MRQTVARVVLFAATFASLTNSLVTFHNRNQDSNQEGKILTIALLFSIYNGLINLQIKGKEKTQQTMPA